MIKFSNKLLLNLVNTTLDSAQIQSGKFKPITETFKVSRALNEIIELMFEDARVKRNLLFTEISPKLKEQKIVSDKQRIQQITLNLISNAVKFTRNGDIKVSADIKDFH